MSWEKEHYHKYRKERTYLKVEGVLQLIEDLKNEQQLDKQVLARINQINLEDKILQSLIEEREYILNELEEFVYTQTNYPILDLDGWDYNLKTLPLDMKECLIKFVDYDHKIKECNATITLLHRLSTLNFSCRSALNGSSQSIPNPIAWKEIG